MFVFKKEKHYIAYLRVILFGYYAEQFPVGFFGTDAAFLFSLAYGALIGRFGFMYMDFPAGRRQQTLVGFV